MKPKEKITIELYEEYENVHFYTLKYDSKEKFETDEFFIRYYDDKLYEEDIEIISKVIEKIGKKGAELRYFRPEGKMADQVGALPEQLYTSSLRLYAIRLTKNIVILGNGGCKTTATYNEDTYLNNCVEVLQKVNHLLNTRIRIGEAYTYNKLLTGHLKFYI